jgi:glycine oxidase
MGSRTEVIVVGGGAIGSAVTFELRQRGHHVTLLERQTIASGASSNNAGLLVPEVRPDAPPVMARFWQQSLEEYPSFLQAITEITGTTVPLERLGRLQLWVNGSAPDDLHKHAGAQREAGIRAEVLDAAAVQALEPKLVAELAGAILFPDHARLDAAAMTTSAADAARKLGATIREDQEVLSLLTDGDRVCGVQLRAESIRSDWVVLCAGAASGSMRGLALTLPIRPVKGQVIICRPPTRQVRTIIAAPPIIGGLIPLPDGRMLIASTYDDAGFDLRPTAGAAHDLLAGALTVLPDLRDAALEGTRVGLRPFTPDGMPIIGKAQDGLLVATGHGRMGIVSTPLTARVIADLVDGRQSTVPLEPFRPDRFPV